MEFDDNHPGKDHPHIPEGKPLHDPQCAILPTPVQTPRIPIWVAGVWPHKAPLRRAARWDGVYLIHTDDHPLQPDEIGELLRYVGAHRASHTPFDVVVAGYVGHMPTDEVRTLMQRDAEAGVTWWQKGFLHPVSTR